MKLYQNTMIGLRHRGWTRSEAIAYFVKGAARELQAALSFKRKRLKLLQEERIKWMEKSLQVFQDNWLTKNGNESYFDFGICKLPDISDTPEEVETLMYVFNDSFLFPCFLNDNYDRKRVEYFDFYMAPQPKYEGPYGYTDGAFDVSLNSINRGVVIDVGAWIGDFSAYAVSKGATVYAFEPAKNTFLLLCKTRDLNSDKGQIVPVQKGLGSEECEMDMILQEYGQSAGNTFIKELTGGGG
jgi:hypothetical protein